MTQITCSVWFGHKKSSLPFLLNRQNSPAKFHTPASSNSRAIKLPYKAYQWVDKAWTIHHTRPPLHRHLMEIKTKTRREFLSNSPCFTHGVCLSSPERLIKRQYSHENSIFRQLVLYKNTEHFLISLSPR